MKQRSLTALVVLNVAILVGLVTTLLAPAPSQAQIGGAAGNYLMVSGRDRGSNQYDVVYILDLNRQALFAVMFDSNRNELLELGRRNVRQDAQRGGR